MGRVQTRARRCGRSRAAVVGVAFVALLGLLAVPTAGAAVARDVRDARVGARSDTPRYQDNVDAAIADIQGYWADTFPDVYGTRYIPIPRDRIFAGRPGVRLPLCQGERLGYRDVADNAFYCYRDNYIAYDDAGLFRDLHESFGPFSVSLVLAHEWGHAIQDRADAVGQPTIDQELQADCFAGAWTRHVSDDETDVAYGPGDLEIAIAALLAFRDAPGASPDDPSAHGSAFDRIGAFQDGFESGPRWCAGYVTQPPLVVQIPFSSEAEARQGGNVPAADVIPLTIELLNDFYAQVEPAYVPLTIDDVTKFDSSKKKSIPRCGATRPKVAQVQNRVYFCIDDEYLAFDEPFLQQIYDEIGDFGVATLIANPWATYVQIHQEIPGAADNTLEAVLQADCYTGGWAAAFYNGYLGVPLSPGDLDEFVQAFLVYSRARGVAADVPITFVRVRFFRRGFLTGYQSCAYEDVAREVAAL